MRPQPFISLVIELVDRSSGLDKDRFFVKIRFVVYSLKKIKRFYSRTFLAAERGSQSFSEVLSRCHVGDGELEEDVGEAAISDDVEERIENLKQEKAKQKF